jgi:hypothetical protein
LAAAVGIKLWTPGIESRAPISDPQTTMIPAITKIPIRFTILI